MDLRNFERAERTWERIRLDSYLDGGCNEACVNAYLDEHPNASDEELDALECNCDEIAAESQYAYEESLAEDMIERGYFY